jgi:adenylyltransferase/sulfurtransferase
MAFAALTNLNTDVSFDLYNVRLTANNVVDILNSFDIILDGSDNFPTRYLVNDACVILNKILVYGAVSQYEGQLAIFNCRVDDGKTPVNYRDLFPDPPLENEVLNCEEAGVLGVVPGIIGSMMANEAIKLITGIGDPLIDKLLSLDVRVNRFFEIELTAAVGSRARISTDIEALKNVDYEWICSRDSSLEIENESFNELLQANDVTVVDVREIHELPQVNQFECLSIPMGQLKYSAEEFDAETIVFFCQSGKRSLQAAKQMEKVFGGSKKIFSLKGGIVQWLQQQKATV